MDPVTHCLTGACLARSGFRRKTAYATAAMVLAAEAPDLDTLWSIRGPVALLAHHRGILHSLIAASFMALAMVGVFWLWNRLRAASKSKTSARKKSTPWVAPHWGWLWLGCLIADLSHLLLDYTNSYGLRPFLPWNQHWFAASIVSIFDPYIFLALLLALLLPALLRLTDHEIGDRRPRWRGQISAILALSFMVFYWGLRTAEHARALGLLRNNNGLPVAVLRVAAEPDMLNPFVWTGLLATSTGDQIARVSTLNDQVSLLGSTLYTPAVTRAVIAAKDSSLGRVYLDWSKWPWVEDMGEIPIPGQAPPPTGARWHAVHFSDLRYAALAGTVGINASEADSGRSPLSGWAYVSLPAQGAGKVEAIFLDGRRQP